MKTDITKMHIVRLSPIQNEILMASLRSCIAEHKADGTESGQAFAVVLRTVAKHIERQTGPKVGRPVGFKPKKRGRPPTVKSDGS